jgi:hypothetical protein
MSPTCGSTPGPASGADAGEDALTVTTAEGISSRLATFSRAVKSGKGVPVREGTAIVNLAGPAPAEVRR